MSPPTAAPLASLQQFLAGAFVREESVTADPALVASCTLHVSGNDRVSPAEQVDIYRRQFWLKHRGCLAEDYPGLLHILGDDEFDRFCRAYLDAHPPSSPSLRDLGEHIVAFCLAYDGFDPARAAIARDMVRYEHSFVDLFDAADPPPLDIAKVTSVPDDGWDVARIVLHPHLVRLRVDYPVHRIRAALKSGESPKLPLSSPAAVFLALYRKDLIIHFDPIPAEAYRLLAFLAEGLPLPAACGRVAEGLDDAKTRDLEAKVGRWFRDWAAAGWFVDILYEPT